MLNEENLCTKYKIIYKDGRKIETGILDIYRKLDIQCEIYEILDGEKYFSHITKRILYAIAIELAESATKIKDPNYFYKLKYFGLLRKWLYDSEEISDSDIMDARIKLRDSATHIIHLFLAIDCNKKSLNGLERHHLLRSIIELPNFKNKDYICGKILIDFLNSGKHLFMV